jgi:hypothetical protein
MSTRNEYPNEPFTRWRQHRTRLASASKQVTLTYEEARVEVDHPIVEDTLVAAARGAGRLVRPLARASREALGICGCHPRRRSPRRREESM